METRLKMRISRMFRSSFGSCRSRNFSDVTEKAVFPHHHNHRVFIPVDPSSPPKQPRPFPSFCGPKALATSHTIDSHPRKKVSEWPSSPLLWRNRLDRRTCPPVSPITPLNPVYEDEFGYCEKLKLSGRKKKSKKKTKKKKKKKETRKKRKPSDMFPFNSCAQDGTIGGYWWYNNDDDDDDDSEAEDETETLFSSRSHSSDSSRRRRRCHRYHLKKKDGGGRVGSGGSLSSEMGMMPLKGRVKDTFAVVKRSSDPYNDFRTSMVEMIVEKQIFAPKDLENLLQCFLSLNAHNHHTIIIEVFTEIWEALFSDWL